MNNAAAGADEPEPVLDSSGFAPGFFFSGGEEPGRVIPRDEVIPPRETE